MVFLLVVVGFFISNVNHIYVTESNAKVVELSARQISLPHRISKNLNDLYQIINAGEFDFRETIGSLRSDIESFNKTLLIIKSGGQVNRDAVDEAPITVQPINEEGQKIIDQILTLWQPYFDKSQEVFTAISDNPEQRQKAKKDIEDAYLQAKTLSINSVRSMETSLTALDADIQDERIKEILASQIAIVKKFDEILVATKDEKFTEPAIRAVRGPLIEFDETLNNLIAAQELKENEEDENPEEDDNPIDLSIFAQEKQASLLAETKTTWEAYKEKLNLLIFEFYRNQGVLNFDSDVLIPLIEDTLAYIDENAEEMSNLMDQLTVVSEGVILEDSKVTRQFQITGIFVALLIFLFILDRFFVQLRKSDAEIQTLQKESEQIFETVDQGLFLLDKESQISAQHSKELLSIFGVKELANKKLDNFLKNIISNNDLEKLTRYLNLLFDPKKKEKLIKDLNPLNEVSVQIQEQDEIINKHLRFGFSRVLAEDKVENILTSVSDVTQEVLLAKQLEQESKRGDQQLQLLSTLLKANSELLPTFINNSEKTYSAMNTELRKPASEPAEFKSKVNTLGMLIHKVKGESSALSLDMITDACHEFEDQIEGLKELHQIDGNNFLPLTVLLERLIGYNKIVSDLYDKVFKGQDLSQVSQTNGAAPAASWSHLIGFADKIAERSNKSVELRHSGLDSSGLSEKVSSALPVLTSQFLRNAIVHGIESEEERQKLGKNKTGQVSLSLYQNGDGLIFECVDDGSGIDTESIAKQAVEKGLITQERLDKMSTIQKMALIFKAGFSTSETTDEDSGRGMGMSAVQDLITELSGKILISSKLNQYTKFSIKLPNT